MLADSGPVGKLRTNSRREGLLVTPHSAWSLLAEHLKRPQGFALKTIANGLQFLASECEPRGIGMPF